MQQKNQLVHKGKVVGRLAADDRRHLIKSGKQVMLFRIYDGFGMSVEVLEQVDRVTVHHNGISYTATTDEFWTHGIDHDFYGDKQKILPRKFWLSRDSNQITLV